MARLRVQSWPESRNCRRQPECMTIDGHYGRCILPTERTRKAIAEDPKLRAAVAFAAKKKRQLALFGSGG